ncbi:MAG: copper amine oxidase N-terminal domain-containing protein, partial [Clostridia bacterium]|nr:copper amine oxidase N-terminal domain-containing protein [Clostridia bacterium]
AIRRDYTREGEEEFSKIFYKDNKNLIVMEIGNESYFNNIEKFAFDVAPEITKDRTFVPLRSIAEGFGFDVAYDDSEKTITLTKDDTEVIFTIGEEKFIVNGEEKLCDAAPFIKSDRTLLPLRALSEAVGKTVFWESDRKLILIADKLVIDESNKSEHSEELDMLSQWLNR